MDISIYIIPKLKFLEKGTNITSYNSIKSAPKLNFAAIITNFESDY